VALAIGLKVTGFQISKPRPSREKVFRRLHASKENSEEGHEESRQEKEVVLLARAQARDPGHIRASAMRKPLAI
jgi:hypothetical protein